MPKRDEEFLKKLLATFRIEADEHLRTMSSCLLELEQAPAGARRAELVETTFRETHSLKGAARAVNHADMEGACQALESVFASMKRGVSASPLLFDLLYQTLDTLGELLAPDSTAVARPALAKLIRRIDSEMKSALAAPAEASPQSDSAEPVGLGALAEMEALPAARSPAADTVRISVTKLDGVMCLAEELLGARLAAGERARELQELVVLFANRKKARAMIQTLLRATTRSISSSGKSSDKSNDEWHVLGRLVGLLEADNLFMKKLEDQVSKAARSAASDHRAMTAMVDGLLQGVKEMQLLPLSSLLDALSRIVRDLARDRDKQVQLSVRGGEIEIDRRILEELKDPLIHLLRNCVDHGIETRELRHQKGKPAHGTISIAITQKDGGKIELVVADDGAGMDPDKVKAAAAKSGMVSAEEMERLDEREVLMLVFRSGISTSPIITDLSGRGLGLAIVREKVERLGGTVGLETQVGSGTTFRIVLPLMLVTFRGVLVRARTRLFVMAGVNVERAVRVAARDIQTVENRETILLGSQAVSLVRLADVLELPGTDEVGDFVQVVVLVSGIVRVAFQVEAILGEQEVLVKSLGPQLARVRNVSGACVLGTGEVVPVLNVADLMKSATKPAGIPPATQTVARTAEAPRRAVLIVEDSITSRSLLKSILESAGYSVTTAVDGIDGYTALKSAAFDLVVSDVEMPRMDGFDLTAKIRADKQLAALPVVLVTALDQREHRERGIEVGANAYIVKSSFDQSNLLEVVRRMIS